MIWALGIAAALCSTILTFYVREYARRNGTLDIPNSRSSHVNPTPRGGGLAFVLVITVFTICLAAAGIVRMRLAVAIGFGGVLLGGVGWVDDTRDVAPGIRLMVQTVVAVIAVAALHGFPRVHAFGLLRDIGSAGSLLAVIGLVALINIFNFMDGIDGIAAGQGAIATFFAAVILALHSMVGLASAAIVISGALIGFLTWNWPPASIFMGDVGSGFIGFTLGVIGIATESTSRLGVFALLTVVSPFIIDATLTLGIRIAHGQRFWNAHRDHSYQRLTRMAGGHWKITVAYSVVSILAGIGTTFWMRDRTDAALPFVIMAISLSAIYGATRFMGRRA